MNGPSSFFLVFDRARAMTEIGGSRTFVAVCGPSLPERGKGGVANSFERLVSVRK